MNPYLEQPRVWHGFHYRFPATAGALLAAQVDPRYIVEVDEHMYIHELSADERRYLGRPGVFMTPSGSATPLSGGGTATATPLVPVLLPSVDVERQPFLEIRDRESLEVVTAIELLSPSNKYAGPGRDQYLSKRAVYLQSRTNLVELDLLRGGPRLPHYEGLTTEYAALIYRSHEWPRAGVMPIPMREPLPLIPIPLRPPDPDVFLDVKAVLDRIHDEARYATYIYRSQPKPALSPDDTAWAQQFLLSSTERSNA